MTVVEREELKSALELQEELERRYKANPLKYFVPTGKQEEFISKLGSGKYFICVFSGANRTGKSETESNITGNIIWGPQNKWFEHPLFARWPYPKRARIGSTPKNLEEIGAIDVGIKANWPEGKYQAEKAGKRYNSLYKFDNGWIMDVMSYEQATTEWESVSLGLVIFDEPPPADIFKATIARMEQGGVIIVGMTPLQASSYLFDNVITEKEGLKTNQNVFVTYVDVEDACIEHGVRGYLEHKNIEQMVSFYDKDEVDARAHGKPLYLTGLVYPSFNFDIHVIPDFPIPFSWTRAQIVDPHDSIPFAMAWVAVDEIGDYYFYDEYPEEPFERMAKTTMDFKDYATITRNKEGRDVIKHRIMDPNFGNKRYGNTGKTVKEELAEFGLQYNTSITDDLTVGHHLVRERLKYDTSRPMNAINKPKMYVFKRCRNTWVSLMRYGRKPLKNAEMKDNLNLDETYKHFCDLVRYASVAPELKKIGPQVIDPIRREIKVVDYDDIRNSSQPRTTVKLGGGKYGLY